MVPIDSPSSVVIFSTALSAGLGGLSRVNMCFIALKMKGEEGGAGGKGKGKGEGSPGVNDTPC